MRARAALAIGGVVALSGCGLITGTDGTPVRVVMSSPVESPTPSATASMSWATAFERYGPAVVRVAATQCDDSVAVGSGFVVKKDLVVTAAHVVSGGRTVSVQTTTGQTVAARPVLISPKTDTAVLRLAGLLDIAEVLPLASKVPARGTELAVLGYPFGEYQLSIVNGIVSRLPAPVDYGEQKVERAFTSNASTNGGNSGGPVIDHSGRAIGLVSGGKEWSGDQPVEGVNYMIPVSDISAAVTAASDTTSSLVKDCIEDNPQDAPSPTDLVDDDGGPELVIDDESELGRYVAQLLFTHGMAINTGAYAAAFELFTPQAQRKLGGLETWTDGVSESTWDTLTIEKVTLEEDGARASARVSLTTSQPPTATNTECSQWSLTYELSLGETLLVDRVRGPQPSPC